ncbi:cellulase family glycosylhydrolase [Asticcacaulis taihuensis]|uniref:cellulase family glycosylhydrolase n=1 Tax=Asticcacaulis taihuensis TaxID=260084 RepID=UPI003F7B8F58
MAVKHWIKALAAVCLTLTVSGCTTLQSALDALHKTPAPVFHTEGSEILRPDGTAFIARGINLQYGDNPKAALPAIKAISSTGANIIRLQLRRNTSAKDLKKALDRAVALKLPVMVFYWESDITCGTDSARLRRDTGDLWLRRWADVLSERKYQPYLMLNIANEWGSSKDNYANYMATYTDLIRAMRARGYRAPIVIDAADCGQATGSFLEGRGKTLQALDPLHNLIVSVHAYNKPWNSPEMIDRNIADLKSEGVPFLLGEFGDQELAEDGSAVDHLHLMQAAQETGTGWITWSWKGNGGVTKVLDMSESYGKVKLTRRGQEIVDGPYGLRATAR